MSSAENRQALHRLIDELRPEDVIAARRVLETLNAGGDPLLDALANAPIDDEEETAEEHEATERARRDLTRGTVSHEELLRRRRVDG